MTLNAGHARCTKHGIFLCFGEVEVEGGGQQETYKNRGGMVC